MKKPPKKKNKKKNDTSVIITDFVFKKILLENTDYAAKLISWICKLDYEKVVKGHFIDPNFSASQNIEVHRVGDLIYKIDDNTYVDIEAYNKYSRNTDLKNLDYQNRAISRFSIIKDKRGKKTYNTNIKIYFIAMYGNSLKSMSFINHDITYSEKFNNSQFIEISYVCLDKLETIKYTKGKQGMYEYFKALTRLSLKDIENILENNRIVKKDKTLEGVYQSMLMFYKEDGSYDIRKLPDIMVEQITKLQPIRNLSLEESERIRELDFSKEVLVMHDKYFSPKVFDSREVEITPYTYAIHHYQNSWFSHKAKIYYRFRTIMIRLFGYKFVRKAECLLMPWKFK